MNRHEFFKTAEDFPMEIIIMSRITFHHFLQSHAMTSCRGFGLPAQPCLTWKPTSIPGSHWQIWDRSLQYYPAIIIHHLYIYIYTVYSRNLDDEFRWLIYYYDYYEQETNLAVFEKGVCFGKTFQYRGSLLLLTCQTQHQSHQCHWE